MNKVYSEFNKSEMVKKALENRNGVFFPSEEDDVQHFWERLANITSSIKTRSSDNKIHHVSISKIDGYDFLEDMLEELLFLEYIFLQVKNLSSNEFELSFSPQNGNIRTVEYIEYNAEKYKEIETYIRTYGTVTSGLIKIKVNFKPLEKIYNRLSFTFGGERMETTITNISDSNVVMGNSNQISDSYNTTQIDSLPEDVINLINAEKLELLKVGITDEEITDLIKEPSESNIKKFYTKLMPHISTAANLAKLASSLYVLTN